jgi:hypothetical protein
MLMSPRLRRFALLAHVTFSVGWIGAVVVFLALAVIGLTSNDAQTVRGVYLVMEPAARLALMPLAIGSLLSGVAQALGTTWGLFRHSWVVLKLLLNALSMVVLIIYMGTFRAMASVAADPASDLAAVRNPSPALHAMLALLVLLIASLLGTYKPENVRASRPLFAAATAAIVLMVVMAAAHLTGHQPRH